jgi:hypothetical protein
VKAAAGVSQITSADFDGNGHSDFALLVAIKNRTWVAAAYQFDDHWRAGNIDVWDGPRGVAAVEVLRPGEYSRAEKLHGTPLAAGERESLRARLPGILVTFSDGERRAYILGDHRWLHVVLDPVR